MTNGQYTFYHWYITMYTGLSLVICIVGCHFLLGTLCCFVFLPMSPPSLLKSLGILGGLIIPFHTVCKHMNSFEAKDREDDRTAVDSGHQVGHRYHQNILHTVLLRVVVRSKTK